MREIPGVPIEQLEGLYLLASAKANLVAAIGLLREAIGDLEIVSDRYDVADALQRARPAFGAMIDLRDRVFTVLEDAPR